MPRTCYDCAQPVEDQRLLCPHCGGRTLTDGRAHPTRFVPTKAVDLPFPWSCLQAWEAGGVISIAGPPGSGKSTVSALLPCDLWLSCEQTPAQVATLMHRVRPRNMPEIATFGRHNGDRVPALLAASPGARWAILDSLTAAATVDDQVRVLEALIQWAQLGARRVAVILGVTSEDQAAGRRQLRHMVDACVNIALGDDGLRTFEVDKNRFGPLGAAHFALGEAGAGRPALEYSYSVEGRPGAYRLVPYPTERAQWDGLLRQRFKRVSRPGYASAARPMVGYRGGVLEPADVAARRRFAESHGLTWLDPADTEE